MRNIFGIKCNTKIEDSVIKVGDDEILVTSNFIEDRADEWAEADTIEDASALIDMAKDVYGHLEEGQ